MIRYRDLTPGAQFAAKATALLVIFASLTAYGIQRGRERMELASSRQRICRAELAALTARNAFVEKFARPTDACLALEVAAR